MIGIAAHAALADEDAEDEKKDEPKSDQRKGGNAIDNATSKPAAAVGPVIDRASLPPGYYEDMGQFWATLYESGSFIQGAHDLALKLSTPSIDPPSLSLYIKPVDGPAESVLDQIDESQAAPLLVGQPGSEANSATGTGGSSGSTATAPATAEVLTPPPESILDVIDGAPPAPQPAAPSTQASVKPAVNQTPRPAAVETRP